MRRFIKHIAAFFMLLAILMLAIFVFNQGQMSNPIKINAKILATGDSHMACAFRPQFYPHSANISQTAEPLITSFFKIKKLIIDNPEIDTVIIGISYNSFSDYNDEKFMDGLWANNQLGRTTSLMSLSDYKGYSIDTNTYNRKYFKNTLVIPQTGDPSYVGKYIPKESGLEKSSVEKIISKQYYSDSTLRGVSQNSLNYIDSIIKWTKTHEIIPIIVCPPLHKEYRERVPDIFYYTMKNVLKKYQAEGLKTVNFSSQHMPDSLFSDHTHLDKLGAMRFTKMLKSTLDN